MEHQWVKEHVVLPVLLQAINLTQCQDSADTVDGFWNNYNLKGLPCDFQHETSIDIEFLYQGSIDVLAGEPESGNILRLPEFKSAQPWVGVFFGVTQIYILKFPLNPRIFILFLNVRSSEEAR